MSKQILIPYEEYLELSSDAITGKELLNSLKDVIKVEQVYKEGLIGYGAVANINSEKLKEMIKKYLKFDEINII